MSVELMHDGNDAAVVVEESQPVIAPESCRVLAVESCKCPMAVLREAARWKLTHIEEKIVNALIETVLTDQPGCKPNDFGGHSREVLADCRSGSEGCAGAAHPSIAKGHPTSAAICVVEPTGVGGLGQQCGALRLQCEDKSRGGRMGKWICLEYDIPHVGKQHVGELLAVGLKVCQIAKEPAAPDVVKLRGQPAPFQYVIRCGLERIPNTICQPSVERRRVKAQQNSAYEPATLGPKPRQ